MSDEIKIRCEVCGNGLVYFDGKPRCVGGLGHTIGPPCTRKEFNAAVKAAELAALPRAEKLVLIGCWRIDGHPGVFTCPAIPNNELSSIPGSVCARVFGGRRWFIPAEDREWEIESAGFEKVKA